VSCDFTGPEEYLEEEWREIQDMFADPGGESALRRSSPSNLRDLPCPTCGEPDRLTPADVRAGYQCDTCATRDEGTYVGGDY
jgi:hypothetical protein